MKLEENILHLFEVPQQQAALIESKFVLEEYDKGQVLLQEGKECNFLSFIEAGYCRVFKLTEQKEFTQWIGGEGYFITDLSSFLFDQKSNWSIEALSPLRLWTLSKADYKELELHIPGWNILEKRFIAKCFMEIEKRVFDFISLSAEERYLKYFEKNKAMFNQVPLQYIASVLGMSPETLSRIRSKV